MTSGHKGVRKASIPETAASVDGPMSKPTVPLPTQCFGMRYGRPAQTSWAYAPRTLALDAVEPALALEPGATALAQQVFIGRPVGTAGQCLHFVCAQMLPIQVLAAFRPVPPTLRSRIAHCCKAASEKSYAPRAVEKLAWRAAFCVRGNARASVNQRDWRTNQRRFRASPRQAL